MRLEITGPSVVPDVVNGMWGFTGRMEDLATDLRYNRARWYDAAIGRFISEDPIGLGGAIRICIGMSATIRSTASTRMASAAGATIP